MGIGHTRWATHGRPSDRNAHPHTSGEIAIVHNGIIENYLELRDILTEMGYEFSSETDSEVLAHLIHFYYKGDLLAAVCRALDHVEGSYAVAVMAASFSIPRLREEGQPSKGERQRRHLSHPMSRRCCLTPKM